MIRWAGRGNHGDFPTYLTMEKNMSLDFEYGRLYADENPLICLVPYGSDSADGSPPAVINGLTGDVIALTMNMNGAEDFIRGAHKSWERKEQLDTWKKEVGYHREEDDDKITISFDNIEK